MTDNNKERGYLTDRNESGNLQEGILIIVNKLTRHRSAAIHIYCFLISALLLRAHNHSLSVRCCQETQMGFQRVTRMCQQNSTNIGTGLSLSIP